MGQLIFFSQFQYSYNAPDNTRLLTYDICNQSVVNNGIPFINSESTVVSGVEIKDYIKNVVMPKMAFSAWYCTKITNPSIEKQEINLVYSTYGNFNFFQEIGSSYGSPKEILLKEIISTVNGTWYEKLVLDHKTLMSLIALPQLIDYTNTAAGASQFDDMYSSIPVYSQGGSGAPSFNWTRYAHAAADISNNNAVSVNPVNPYLTGSHYKRNAVSGSSIAFNHGFLESGRITNTNSPQVSAQQRAMIPGDIYELKTSISNVNGTIDLAIVSGDCGTTGTEPQGSGTYSATYNLPPSGLYSDQFYKRSRGIELFSTFNMALKWGATLSATYTSGVSTSNFFVMPNVPFNFQGFNIQVGAGNSDVDHSLMPSISNQIYSSMTAGFNGKKGYSFMNGSSPKIYKSGASIAHNFGNGYPWSMVLPFYRDYAGFPSSGDKSVYANWWSTQQMAGQTSTPSKHNRPTGLGFQSANNTLNPATLNWVKLIRYSKNPYMLQGAMLYRNNNGTSELIAIKRLEYTHQLVDLVENYAVTTEQISNPTPKIDPTRKRVIVLLSSVTELPLNVTVANMYTTNYGLTALEASKVLTTSFTYAPLNLTSLSTWHAAIKLIPLYTLSSIVDPLGGVTTIVYNNVVNADLSDLMPSYVFSPIANTNGTPIYGNNSAYLVRPIVASVSKQNEVGGLQTYSYVFSSPIMMNSIYDVDNDHFRNNFVKSVRRGFMTVTINKPAINGVSAYSVVTHYGQPVGTTLAEKELNYLCFGKVKSTSDYMNGILNTETKNTYDYTLAFQNGAIRPSFSKNMNVYDANMTNQYLYEDYYVAQTNFTSLAENKAALVSLETEFTLNDTYPMGELPKMMEGNFYSDLLLANGGNEFLFNSYFVKLVSESKKVYDDGIFKAKSITGECLDRDGRPMICPNVIEPTDCNNATTAPRLFVETISTMTYYEADYTGKAIGNAYYNLFSINPAAPVSTTFNGVTKSNAIILLKHEPSWQIASVKSSSPQMGVNANTKDEFFYFYDLVNRYDRHWYLMDANANPNYTLTVFNNANTLYTDPIAVNNVVASTARLNSWSLPFLEGMQSAKVNNTRSLAYQKTSWSQNSNDLLPVSKSEYYHFDNSWTYTGTYNVAPAIPNVQTLKPVLLRSTYIQIDDAVNESTFTKMDRNNTYIAEFKAVLTGSTDGFGKNYLYSISLPYANLKLKNVNTRTALLQPSIIENQMGVQTAYAYLTTAGNLGLLSSIKVGNTLPDAQTTSFTYTPKGLVLKITEPSTRTLDYVYDNYLRLFKTTENGTRILSENVYNTWNDNNTTDNFTLRTDQNFVQTKVYNSAIANDFEINKSFIDPLGRNHSILKAYTDDNGILIRLQSPTVVYDNWNRVQKTYKPYIGPVTANLNLGSNTTTAFEEQQYENQLSGRVIKSSDFGEDITTSTHTSRVEYKIINAVAMFCELGITNEEAKMVITARGNGHRFNYFRTRSFDQDNKESIQYTNAFGQIVATVSYTAGTTKAITLFGYDSYGNLNKVINPNKQVTTYLYNILGQLTRETSVDGGTKKYMYNKLGLVSVSQNEEERTRGNSLTPVFRVFKYDNYGKVISVGLMNVPYYAQTLSDPLLYETVNNATTVYTFTNLSTYDWTSKYYKVNGSQQMVLQTITPAFFVTNQFEKSFAYGSTVNTASLGKLITENSFNNAGVKILKNNYTYDVAGTINSQTTVFSPINADGAVSLTTTKIDYPVYNYRGSLLEEKIDMDNDLVTDLHLFYDYDALNRLTSVSAALGSVTLSTDATKLVSYEYDIYGHISKKQHFVDDNSNLSKLAMEIVNSYDMRDRLTQIEAKQGTTSVFKNNLYYDAQNPVDGVETVLADQNWNGNINGSLTAYNFGTSSTPISTFGQKTLYGYKYDLMNRLVTADARVGDYVTALGLVEGVKVGDENYTYDKIGNITSLQRFLRGVSPTTAQVEQWVYNYTAGTNKLASVTGAVGTGTADRTYSYDANGNLKTDTYKAITATNYGRASYAYRITKGSDIIDYLYDTKDQRMYKKVDATDNNFDTEEYYIQDIFGRTVAIRKTQVGVNTWNYYVSGNGRELSIQPAASQSPGNNAANTVKRVGFGKLIGYINDYLGNTRVSYTPTAWNATTLVCDYTVSYVADYSPYGKVVREYKNGEPTKYVTTEHERDAETGLDYRGARYYDCDVARFLSADPLAHQAFGWSPYRYCFDNPIKFIDPKGKYEADVALSRREKRDIKRKHKETGDENWKTNATAEIDKIESDRVAFLENKVNDAKNLLENNAQALGAFEALTGTKKGDENYKDFFENNGKGFKLKIADMGNSGATYSNGNIELSSSLPSYDLSVTILHEYIHSASNRGLIQGDQLTEGYKNLIVNGRAIPLSEQLNALNVARSTLPDQSAAHIADFNSFYPNNNYNSPEGGYLFEVLGFGTVIHPAAKEK
jgi:RHS repeat-associated protein